MFLILEDLHCSILHPILHTFLIIGKRGKKTFNLQPHINPPRTYTSLDLEGTEKDRTMSAASSQTTQHFQLSRFYNPDFPYRYSEKSKIFLRNYNEEKKTMGCL